MLKIALLLVALFMTASSAPKHSNGPLDSPVCHVHRSAEDTLLPLLPRDSQPALKQPSPTPVVAYGALSDKYLNMATLKHYISEAAAVVAHETARVRGKDIVLLLGASGVGKSLFTCFLRGVKIVEARAEVRVRDGSVVFMTTRQAAQGQACPKIGFGGHSETLHVSAYDGADGNTVILDVPGWDESRGVEVEIQEVAGVRQVLHAARSAKIILLLSYQDIEYARFTQFKRMLSMIAAIFERGGGSGSVLAALDNVHVYFTQVDNKGVTIDDIRTRLLVVHAGLVKGDKDVLHQAIVEKLIDKIDSQSAFVFLATQDSHADYWSRIDGMCAFGSVNASHALTLSVAPETAYRAHLFAVGVGKRVNDLLAVHKCAEADQMIADVEYLCELVQDADLSEECAYLRPNKNCGYNY